MPRPQPTAPPLDIPVRRSSSVREFLTSDNSATSGEQPCLVFASPREEAEHRRQLEREDQLRRQFAQLQLGDLKERLKRKNCAVGPMDGRNRRVYEAKLAKLEVGQAKRDPDSIIRWFF